MSSSSRIPSGTEYEQLLSSLRLERTWSVIESRRDVVPPVQGAPAAAWRSIRDLIDHQVERCADDIALAHRDARVTYRELGRRTDELAGALRAGGIARGDLVAVVLDRGVEFVEAALALWKLGAAYLPLSPAHPERWRAEVARRAGVRLTIGSSITPAILGLPHVVATAAGLPIGGPVVLEPADLAYVICTSGSTGEPKLVMIEHRGIANLVQAQHDYLPGLGPGSRVLQFFHPAFDAALFDIISALAHGGRLEILDEHQVAGGPLADALVSGRITHAVVPAPVLRTLEPGGFPDLAVLLSIGDVCLPQTARRWRAHHRFINGYGPTEVTVCSTLHIVEADLADGARVPIGREIAGYHITICDDELRPVADGLPGEICIAGDGVGRGYLGQPGLTTERFVDGGRLYRTGDLGRRLADGNLEFLGRRDDQVKIRGVRIELGEIERALAALPEVADAVVLADLPDRGHDRHLIGYVIGAPASALTSESLRDQLRDRLPSYLVPEQVVILREWPLTTSGKVDRGRLPRPTRPVDVSYQPPRTADQAAVASLAAELLGIERIGIDDNLFERGGHSLFASQLVARVRAQLHRQIELSAVLRGATIAEIAASLTGCPATAQAEPGDRGPDIGPVPATAGDEIRPSHAQQRVWLMHKLAPDARAYHSQAVIRFAGELDLVALEASLTDLVRRHDVLRSRFPEVAGELRCELEAPWPVELAVHDLRAAPGDRGSRVGDAVRDIVQRPFDLARGRLARWELVRVADDEHLLVHVEHHIVHDGWSFNLFLGDLIEGYHDYRRYGELRRPPLAVQYYDYARWHRQWCETAAAAAQARFWRAALADAPTVLPLARQGATGSREFVGRAPRLEIDGELAGELEQLSHRAGGSVFTTLLTAFFVLLQRYTGASDLLVGSAVANRRWQTTEAVLGMFVNTVVFRGRLGGDPTFVELLARVRQMSLEAYDHQDLPFETVVKQLAIEHVQGVNPLIQTMFNFHDTQLRALSAAPLEITAIEGLANGSAKFELSVIGVPRYAAAAQIARLAGGVIRIPRSDQPVWPGPRVRLQGITLAWEFNAARFDDEFIAGMLGAYHQLLRSVVATPDAAISSLELLDEPTRRDLIARGRGPARDWQSHGWIPAAVDRWAERTPDAPALASHDRVVSYGELTRRADRLARRLRGLGIARDAVIGVCVPSSLDAAVAQLGVLKSGAAYLPLDPDHPQPWLAELLGDSGARAVVTSSATAGRIPASPAWTLVLLDELDDREAGGAALPVGQPSDLAYLIYTSGSTGRPKGVQVEHRSIAARFAQPGALDLGPGDTMLALASTAFDASVMELWAPLIHGASVHFPDRGWGIGELVRCLADHRISHVFLTTPLFHQVIDEAPAAFDRVRRLLFGGDVASPEIVRTLGDRGVEGAFNVYGPTETTVIATAQAIRAWRGPGDSVPIGSPLPNAHVVVLDDTRQLAPPGAVGEIWIGGPGVARGYLGAPALTAERFVEDPFDPAPGSRLYRTGDLGRWRAGALEFHGRRDHQVKIRGFRIELDEVRAAIARLPNVGSALVVVDRTGADARLLGYVVAEPGAELSGSAVRAALAGQLPGHMIPSSITVVERWPLTANGKIDAARLANARAEAAGDASGAPETADETVIAGMVAQVLGIARVGVHDSLYELGMDSLQAMKLASSIAAATRCDLGLASVLAHPTVAGLARELEARRTAGGAVTSIRRLPR